MDVLTALQMERLALVAQATGDVIRDWDVARGTIWLNEALTGWGHSLDRDAEVEAAWWDAHIHPDDAAKVRASLERAFRSNDTRWSAEYRFRRGDGTYGFVLERALLIRVADGTVSRLVAAIEDITARADAEQARATMAHDFNNVLMGIQPFAEVVRKRTTDPRITHAANQILKAVARGQRITQDLLRMLREIT
jgi:PAS domain S-box-containing protein